MKNRVAVSINSILVAYKPLIHSLLLTIFGKFRFALEERCFDRSRRLLLLCSNVVKCQTHTDVIWLVLRASKILLSLHTQVAQRWMKTNKKRLKLYVYSAKSVWSRLVYHKIDYRSTNYDFLYTRTGTYVDSKRFEHTRLRTLVSEVRQRI